MSALILLNAQVQIGSTWSAPATAPGLSGTVSIAGTISSASDISSYVFAVEAPWKADVQDVTNLGGGGYIQKAASLKSAEFKLGINQDFAAAAIDSILRPLYGSLIYVDVKPTSSGRGATNPSYVYAVLVTQYVPIMGQVGQKVGPSLSWEVTGKFDALTS